MSGVTIRIPTPLRSYTGGADEVRVQAQTVGEALHALGAAHDGVLWRILDAAGERYVSTGMWKAGAAASAH